MSQVHFNSLDLNLLRVLSVLTEERSVTRAGARLGLTQSAVSHALTRLRDALDDPLFVRDARGMQPTERAKEIAAGIQAGLAQIQASFAAPFVAAHTERRFTIATGAYICTVLIPLLVEHMREAAPHAQLRIRHYGNDVDDLIATGQVDLVIGDRRMTADRFASAPLFNESLVWVAREGHPIAQGPLTIEALAAQALVAIDKPRDWQERGDDSSTVSGAMWFDNGAFDIETARRNLKPRIGVIAPDSQSAMEIVRRTDMITMAPRRLAQSSIPAHGLVVLDPPYDAPAVTASAIFRRDRLDDAAFAWLLEALTSISASI